MDSLFAQLDTACPESLFAFLANAEQVGGELTQFALRLARECPTLEQLKAMSEDELLSLGRQIGMAPAHIDCILERLHVADPRFEHPKEANGHVLTAVVQPMPRWGLKIFECFDLLDTDRSGTVDLGEYLALGSPFSFLDLAGGSEDGTISRDGFLKWYLERGAASGLTETELELTCDQMKEWLKKRPPLPTSNLDRPRMLTKLFRLYDSDGNGELDPNEFAQYATTDLAKQTIGAWFEYCDKIGDRDGKVQLDEWLKAMAMLNQSKSDEEFAAEMEATYEHINRVRKERRAASRRRAQAQAAEAAA